MLHRSMMNK